MWGLISQAGAQTCGPSLLGPVISPGTKMPKAGYLVSGHMNCWTHNMCHKSEPLLTFIIYVTHIPKWSRHLQDT